MSVPVPIIIGDPSDEHVAEVSRLLGTEDLLVINPARLEKSEFVLDSGRIEIVIDGRRLEVGHRPSRGWFRRLTPEGWHDGMATGSLESAAATAWLVLLGGLMRLASIEWLSEPDQSLIAENKIFQLETARRAGLRVPKTVITNSRLAAARQLGSQFVVKPLGPGHFRDESGSRVVFAQSVHVDQLVDLQANPPFILQEELIAVRHLRVVVVQMQAWVFALNAEGVPLDWRSATEAHDSFRPYAADPSLKADAIAVCRALNIGYASQDWIQTDQALYLIDVNPGGQWLFLPQPGRDEISEAIVKWLRGSS